MTKLSTKNFSNDRKHFTVMGRLVIGPMKQLVKIQASIRTGSLEISCQIGDNRSLSLFESWGQTASDSIGKKFFPFSVESLSKGRQESIES